MPAEQEAASSILARRTTVDPGRVVAVGLWAYDSGMAQIARFAVKNPKVFAAIIGAVIGLIVGLIIDAVLFHAFVRGLVLGAVIGGALGWWQHKLTSLRKTHPV